MPRTGERDGKFTVQERKELKDKAWRLAQGGMSQLDISVELDVSQSSVCRWLKAMESIQPKPHHVIAEKIRAKLVCCDIYQRMEAVYNPEGTGDWMELRHGPDYHDICFYGEWAARIAEQAA